MAWGRSVRVLPVDSFLACAPSSCSLRSVGPRDPLTNSRNSGAFRPSRPPTWREHLGHRAHQNQRTQSTAPGARSQQNVRSTGRSNTCSPFTLTRDSAPRLPHRPGSDWAKRSHEGAVALRDGFPRGLWILGSICEGVPVVSASAAFSGLSLDVKNGRKNATAPGKKVGEEKSLAPVFAEKLISPSRRGAKLKDHESYQENEDRNTAEPLVAFKLFVGNLNFNKTVAELQSGLSEFFAKNDLEVVGVRVALFRRFGYVNFKSVDDQEKALELSDTKILGYEIKFKKPKGKKTKVYQNAKTLLIKNVSDRVTQHELKEVFQDAFQIRLVSKAGMNKSCGIAYIEFKSQAEAGRALEAKQGTEVDGLAIVLDHIGEKSQGQKK
ncbi:nucleolin-like [Cebus imitator]|uniref:nucleolin-like n=1 Tax=Cebus imitator TaxID=2715852 RepID=UPI001899099D|nr:nucleolin-like [Cebus imitator]